MWIALYPFMAALDVFAALFSMAFVNWWAPLFAVSGTVCDAGVCRPGVRLPHWLAWFDTFDADIDTGNRDRYGDKGYWGRVLWLYRNHAYGFGYWALGAWFARSDWRVARYEPGERFTFIAVSKDGKFNVHVVRFGIRFKLGWKAWNYYDHENGAWKEVPWGPEWRVPFTFSISLSR